MSHILTDDGTVALVVTTLSPATNREQQERQIVDQLTALLKDTSDERREELFEEAR